MVVGLHVATSGYPSRDSKLGNQAEDLRGVDELLEVVENSGRLKLIAVVMRPRSRSRPKEFSGF